LLINDSSAMRLLPSFQSPIARSKVTSDAQLNRHQDSLST